MNTLRHHGSRPGFTLVEVLIAVGLFSLITAGVISVYLMCQRVWLSTSLKMRTTRDASMAIARIVYGPGPHSGLRSAASIQTNSAQGVFLTGGGYPPDPGSPQHYLTFGTTPDGSWRLVFSNSFDGVRWIDYNRAASNIVFWPNTNEMSSRLLICNHVVTSSVAHTADGLSVSLTIAQRDGRFTSTNHAQTFIKPRN